MNCIQQKTVFDPVTGRIVALLSGPSTQIQLNVSKNHDTIDGHYDPTRYVIVGGQPQLRPVEELEADQLFRRKLAAKQDILRLEGQQARAMREEILGKGDPNTARQRLEDIDAEIEALRVIINPPQNELE